MVDLRLAQRGHGILLALDGIRNATAQKESRHACSETTILSLTALGGSLLGAGPVTNSSATKSVFVQTT
jgi:hypothetical protein